VTEIAADAGPAAAAEPAGRELQRRAAGLSARLDLAFARDQRGGLMIAALVRLAAIVPIAAWLIYVSPFQGAAYWWQVGNAAVFIPTSALHYFAARAVERRFAAVYALFAADTAIMAAIFALPNPFLESVVPVPTQLGSVGFFWFFILMLHAAFSANWRLVVWTGAMVFIARCAQVAFALAQPLTLTEIEWPVGTVELWLQANAEPNFLFLTSYAGDLVGVVSFTLVTAALVRRARRRLERQIAAERTRAQLARYLPSDVVDQVVAQGDAFIAARNVEAAVLFVDVVGFTEFAQPLPPGETITILRALHKRLGDCVFRHDGAIDKFLGDGMMATFGATGPDEFVPRDALAAALDMIATIDEWNLGRVAVGRTPIRIGIGIDFGEVVAGDVGDDRRLEFTVVGNIVNVASRIEQLTRTLPSPLLVTDRLIAAARPTEGAGALIERLEPIGPHTIRGQAEPLPLWGLRRPAE
jgi:adenylate cyclase